ncbi:methyltransferase [Aurantimonas sp. MSK8Z-1]|uniref:class I SAM-dependent methyltransferase n=1 Tax=Mangrovibrevibacter kandeliae TaxID=2968473 RepID=UPI0021186D17|nr:methyltransferase [Aurantimonas sp. MSK8Z-1]MCW4114280.1 methyltransferase [Aurantimonas sp. MSK8Z-1]
MTSLPHGLYGVPPADLVDLPPDALQFSPLMPGAADLAAQPEASLAAITLLAPHGTIERRCVLAAALRALAPGGALTALAPKDKGGSRLAKELEAFGCDVAASARSHHRIAETARPARLDIIAEALADGAPRFDEALGLWTQPGIFSWDRIDPGSALLLQVLPPLAGRGADFGSGLGVLAHAVLRSSKVSDLTLVDLDRRSIEVSRRNVADSRARFLWADARTAELDGLDFVVMNPPFHAAGLEDRVLGQVFIRRAAAALRRGGRLWITANRHLPYEAPLREAFARVEPRADEGGYKVYEAVK